MLQATQRAQSMLVEVMNYSGQTLRALEQVVRALGPLPGRKLVLLLSDGFLVGLGASDTRHFDLRRVTDAATRSGVVLYALDTAGSRGRGAGRERELRRRRRDHRSRSAREPAGAERRGPSGRHGRALRGHGRLPGAERQRPLGRPGPDPPRQPALLPARLPTLELEARRQVPPHRGEAAQPPGPARARAPRLLRRERERHGRGSRDQRGTTGARDGPGPPLPAAAHRHPGPAGGGLRRASPGRPAGRW